MTIPPSGNTPPSNGVFQPPHGGGPSQYPPYPQQPWQQPPAPKGGGGLKWLLGCVALLAIIVLTVVVTISVAGNGDRSSVSASSESEDPPRSGLASANDTGPAAIIVEDATCAAQGPIFSTWVADTQHGWGDRDPLLPASAWTPEIRSQYEDAARVMRQTADELTPLVKATPHRVMRELYQQFMAYARAYADAVPTYTPTDNYLARVTIAAADAVANICAAIDYKSAPARAPLVTPHTSPKDVPGTMDAERPSPFLTKNDVVCEDWGSMLKRFDSDTIKWSETSPDIPASQWAPEQRQIFDDVTPVMRRLASQLQALGAQSDNHTLRDFADLSAQYRMGYVEALPTYTPADKYLANASIRLAGLVNSACQAVEK